MTNTYLDIYFKYLIEPFRRYSNDVFELNIHGLTEFISSSDGTFNDLVTKLKSLGFNTYFEGEDKSVESLKIEFVNKTDNSTGVYSYQLVNLLSIIEFASRTNLSVATILMMRIVSNLICKYRILYKALALDLDDTLWLGTLSEDGIETIVCNMQSEKGKPFIGLMNFVNIMAKELGIFVAICSRNNSDDVKKAIAALDERIFPIKNQIDCIVANHNDKSVNIKAIAEQLNIFPDAIVFIDDNKIERDKVKSIIPEVLVPDWNSHYELITQLVAGCIFDRFELSKNSQVRRSTIHILNEERKNNNLPCLNVKAHFDNGHVESKKLYAKSNQFKFVSGTIDFENSTSVIFEIYRGNGESLGICSAITFIETENGLRLLNWAMSCRFFEIGLEEFILLYLISIAKGKRISFDFMKTPQNSKAQDFVNKYYGKILTDSCDSVPDACTLWLEHDCNSVELLKDKTNLKLL